MILAVDIDGVLCTEERQFSRPLAKALPGAREAIEKLRASGHKVVLYSSRTWAEIEVTKHWLKSNGIEYDGLQLGKMVVDRFIDDRAIHFTSWDEVLTELESPRDVPGGWRAEHHLKILRQETRRILADIASNPNTEGPVLEVGPMWRGSAVFARMPETFIDVRAECQKRSLPYFALDIDPQTGAEFIGDFLNVTEVLRGKRFRTLILMSAIEHMPEIWRVPSAVYDALEPGGSAHVMTPWALRLHGPHPDCWRLSDEAYRALFSDRERFAIRSITKVGSDPNSLNPVGFYCIVQRVR